MSTLRVGLVGAGPWARMWHAPMAAAGPGTELAAVWARRPEAAAEVAERYGGRPVPSFEALLEECDAVAFAVPPDVQAELAPRAAAAGRHLLLEKPLAFSVAAAERIVEAVEAAGVASMVLLRLRMDPRVEDLLARLRSEVVRGATAAYLSDAVLGDSPFATPWRVERGALLDLGPHVLDLLDAALGPVTRISAAGDPTRWCALTTEHRSEDRGAVAVGQAALSASVPGARAGLRLEVVTESGPVSLRLGGHADLAAERSRVRERFLGAVAGEPHGLDAGRGLYLQRLLEAAAADLARP